MPLEVPPPAVSRQIFRLIRLCTPVFVLSACTVLAVPRCSAQDVAEAARQERAQKEKQKKAHHVYTEEDLKKVEILTPEDRAEVEARKNAPEGSAPADKPADAVDAQAMPADEPLGDVARRYRWERQAQRLERSAEFHLPDPAAPVLAMPKAPVMPLRPPVMSPAPPRKKIVVPYQTPVKRSPFARPRVLVAEPPSLKPSLPDEIQVTPSQPAAPARIAPNTAVRPNVPVKSHAAVNSPNLVDPQVAANPPSFVSPTKPVAPRNIDPSVQVRPNMPAKPHVAVNAPALENPQVEAASPALVTPAKPVAPVRIEPNTAVRPNLQAAPPVTLNAPALANPDAPVNPPALANPARSVAPVRIELNTAVRPNVPEKIRVAPNVPVFANPHAAVKAPALVQPISPAPPTMIAVAKPHVVVVRTGDSLWKIAEERLGSGHLWHELLAVNPTIVDANRIAPGTEILVPATTAKIRGDIQVTVETGDTLSSIARRTLGRASVWACIAQANPSIMNPHRIYKGQVLVVPGNCKK